ncbi:hypothetical protein LINPERPRIM_LOCUS20733 [Linum perenne]
MLESVSRLIA